MKYREMVPFGLLSSSLRSKGVCTMDFNEASWTVFLPKLFKKFSVLQSNSKSTLGKPHRVSKPLSWSDMTAASRREKRSRKQNSLGFWWLGSEELLTSISNSFLDICNVHAPTLFPRIQSNSLFSLFLTRKRKNKDGETKRGWTDSEDP